jgi:Sulfotransferase domain
MTEYEQDHLRRGRLFGIGLSRTGTTSLTRALTLLGYSARHFSQDECTKDEVMTFLTTRPSALRLTILRHVDALTDTPVCGTYRALDMAYPGSRFILTLREREGWLASCEEFWHRVVPPGYSRHRHTEFTMYARAVNREFYGTATFDPARFWTPTTAIHSEVDRYLHGANTIFCASISAGLYMGTAVPILQDDERTVRSLTRMRRVVA